MTQRITELFHHCFRHKSHEGNNNSINISSNRTCVAAQQRLHDTNKIRLEKRKDRTSGEFQRIPTEEIRFFPLSVAENNGRVFF